MKTIGLAMINISLNALIVGKQRAAEEVLIFTNYIKEKTAGPA